MTKPSPRTVEVSPGGVTRAAAGPGIVIAILFLAFGVGFLAVVFNETPDSEPMLRLLIVGFGLIWVVACIAIMSVNIRLLRASRNAAPDTLLTIEETAESESPTNATGADFEDRLRKVESLRRDGLISEAEYQRKRDGILSEKW